MSPQAYPLAWPTFRPRTPFAERVRGTFTHAKRPIKLADACVRLEDEVDRLGGSNLIISTNLQPTLSGRPKGNIGSPSDPGAAIYFQLDGDPITLACDKFSDLAQILAGLAAHIDAVRRIERYGVQESKETLQAFAVLPAPKSAKRPWWVVLGVRASASKSEIMTAYRQRAKAAHPDSGGSEEAMTELNAAKQTALETTND